MRWLRRFLAREGSAAPPPALRSGPPPLRSRPPALRSGPPALHSGAHTAAEEPINSAPELAAALVTASVESRTRPHLAGLNGQAPQPHALDEPLELAPTFAALAQGHAPPLVTAADASVERLAQRADATLFLQLAASHARTLHEFIMDLALGPTTKHWLEITAPVVASLVKSAHMLDLSEMLIRLTSLHAAMQRAIEGQGDDIGEAERRLLLSAYHRLSELLPLPDDLEHVHALREPLLVHHLLCQVPSVRGTAIERLYAAGLSSIDALRQASPQELMGLAQLDCDRATAIVERFERYAQHRSRWPARREEAQRLARELMLEHIDRLVIAQRRFRRGEQAEDSEAKRAARSARRASLLDVIVLLVQLGEIELVETLRRLPTEQKIARLRAYIAGLTADEQGVPCDQ